MNKIMLTVPLLLGLYACNGEDTNTNKGNNIKVEESQTEKGSLATETVWEVDKRLQEPTEASKCYMCNMKVYMKDTEMGMFAAQAIREDGSVVFYDDIGCLLNDEYVNNVENEKFVRDYVTLNWFNVEEAIIVKTDLKSPMNWGYIFFKYQEDVDAYLAENSKAIVTPLDQVREEGIERHKKKMMSSDHSHGNTSSKDAINDHDMDEKDSSEDMNM